MGTCATEGKFVCSGDGKATVCNAVTKDPTEEICDGLDNDCDGSVDEDFGPVTCGVGACEVSINSCENGVPQTCTPKDPTEEICRDGIDQDCNGEDLTCQSNTDIDDPKE